VCHSVSVMTFCSFKPLHSLLILITLVGLSLVVILFSQSNENNESQSQSQSDEDIQDLPDWNDNATAREEESMEKRSSIGIVTLVCGSEYHKLLTPESVDNKRDYAKTHGYGFHVVMDQLDGSRPCVWSKILVIQKYLRLYQWIMWIDNDAKFTNFFTRIEDRIQAFSHLDLLIGSDWNGINAGVFFIKNSEWSFQFLKDVYSQTNFIGHDFQEQASMSHLLLTDSNKNHFRLVTPRTLINAYPEEWKLRDFVFHQPGCTYSASPDRTPQACAASYKRVQVYKLPFD